MTSFDKVVIMLHKFDSNSEHTFFTLHLIFGFLLKIVSCDKRLIMKEHLTYSVIIEKYGLFSTSKTQTNRGGNGYPGMQCRAIIQALKLQTGTHGNTVIASIYQLGHYTVE